jgi:hypothetical protein
VQRGPYLCWDWQGNLAKLAYSRSSHRQHSIRQHILTLD